MQPDLISSPIVCNLNGTCLPRFHERASAWRRVSGPTDSPIAASNSPIRASCSPMGSTRLSFSCCKQPDSGCLPRLVPPNLRFPQEGPRGGSSILKLEWKTQRFWSENVAWKKEFFKFWEKKVRSQKMAWKKIFLKMQNFFFKTFDSRNPKKSFVKSLSEKRDPQKRCCKLCFSSIHGNVKVFLFWRKVFEGKNNDGKWDLNWLASKRRRHGGK